MCAACGVPTHIAILDEPEPAVSPGTGTARPAKFTALRNPTCRLYLGGGALAMMADNIEHVITFGALRLVIGGVANLAALSITQTVVQLRAPREKKGQVIGAYGVGANGMRIGSGFTVGLLGAAIGLRPALGWSSLALCACVAALAIYLAAAARRDPLPEVT
jgi:MFS family permease